jgi:hypothetical protein
MKAGIGIVILALIASLSPAIVHAQARVATVGIQLKPVIPYDVFDRVLEVEREHLTGRIELTGGYAFGMSVRIGVTNAISFETGISQIQRNYGFTLANDTNGYEVSDRFRYVGYEVPFSALAYIRLGERLWMNAALGFSLDAYPSDVQKDVERGRLYVFRRNWVQFATLANLGVEFRSERSGYFYVGASYHRPFGAIAVAELTYRGPTLLPYSTRGDLDGSYLTLDLRYYFHEDPALRRTKRDR